MTIYELALHHFNRPYNQLQPHEQEYIDYAATIDRDKLKAEIEEWASGVGEVQYDDEAFN
jgi:hypothetical protein